LFPLIGPVLREMSSARAFIYVFKTHLSKSPVKEPLLHVLPMGPVLERDALFKSLLHISLPKGGGGGGRSLVLGP
jgi:hypothetical protein